jgi:glutathione S-transferase
MSLTLYAHPFSSYCQKVLIALYENELAFDYRLVEGAEAWEQLKSLWSHRKMPLLIDGESIIVESSIILEYLDQHYPGKFRLLPEDPDAAREVRFMDRYFDLYVMTPMNKIVADYLRPEEHRNPDDIRQAKEQLDTSYA